jgi:hypothetical protein
MFFNKNSKNFIWVTNKSKQNSEFFIGFFMFIILCYFLHPNLILDFSIATSISMFL